MRGDAQMRGNAQMWGVDVGGHPSVGAADVGGVQLWGAALGLGCRRMRVPRCGVKACLGIQMWGCH